MAETMALRQGLWLLGWDYSIEVETMAGTMGFRLELWLLGWDYGIIGGDYGFY